MGAPRHLWSGDWRRESEAAARDRAARRGSADVTSDAESAGDRAVDETADTREQATSEQATRAQPAREQATSVMRAPARERPSRAPARGPTSDGRWRALVGFALVAVAVAGAAVVARAIIDGQSSAGSSPPAISTGQPPTAVVGSPWLGVDTQAIPGGGAFVSSVISGGPADDAGIQVGDVIAAINGQPVSGPASITSLINPMAVGAQVTIAIERGGQLLQLEVTLGSRPGGFP
jgi:putative serine protease PepD